MEITADAISEVIGYSGTFGLLSLLGGRDLDVPTDSAADHPLKAFLGTSRFNRLVSAFGGETLALPNFEAPCRVSPGNSPYKLIEAISTNLVDLVDPDRS